MKTPDEDKEDCGREAGSTVPMVDLTPPSSLKEGDRALGRYRVVSKLGRGAMAAVYLCHDEVGGIEVAVKTVPDEFSSDHGEMSMICENFRIVERLHHPNIADVKTLEKDDATGRYFLILEYVPGVSGLQYRIQKEGRLSMAQLLPLARQIAAALDYGHSEGIVHRDIKPANLMITEAGKVKVLDYGIAGQFRESASRLTGHRFIAAGTGVYMAPEQWLGQAQDGRTDQYALAATLYEFFAERPPFDITDTAVLREAVLRERPTAPDDMPDAVWSVFARALAKKRDDRFPSCGAFVDALEEAARGRSAPPSRLRWLAAGIVAAAIAAVGLVFAITRLKDTNTTPLGAEPPRVEPSETSLVAAPHIIPRYRALVIGVNDYAGPGGNGWNRLRTARPDAEAFANLLETQYGFEVQRLFDGEATRRAMIAGLDAVAAGSSDDAIVVYYAGHGFYEEDKGEGYWIPSDARKRAGTRYATEDWVWNSTITKILGSSPARHVLLIADSCFGGSLYRGAETGRNARDLSWYRRAITTPSRYLITSGGFEPVLDSGGRHSIFAQQIMNYVEHADREIFSASELGLAIRDEVSTLTGQLVTMGPLAMATHAGGEFVFLREGAALNGDPVTALLNATPSHGQGPAASADIGGGAGDAVTLRQATAMDAALLQGQGATNAARRILGTLMSEQGEDRLVRAVAVYLDQDRKAAKLAEIRQLVALLSDREMADGAASFADYARPRIVACIGPQDVRGAQGDGFGQLVQICLEAEIGASDRVYLVEREGLEDVLAELNLGTADLSDARAQLEIGKLLPASVLLLSKILPDSEGARISLRAVDTETSRVLFSETVRVEDESGIADACRVLAENAVAGLVAGKPLSAKVWHEDGQVVAGLGLFHGAADGAAFHLLKRTAREGGAAVGVLEEKVGQGRITELGEMTSVLSLESAGETVIHPSDDLWVRELTE